MQPIEWTKIIGRKRYSTKTATLLASDTYFDGHNYERRGTNQFLYRIPNGAYFTVNRSQWQGTQDSLTPISQDEAIDLYEGSLSEHEVDYTQAFPGVEVTAA